MVGDRQRSSLETPLYRTHLPADARVIEVPSGQRLQDHIVTGGGQDFVRVYSAEVYGIPPEQVVGSAGATKFGYDREAKPVLTKLSNSFPPER
jgi:hypothetical protein